MKQRHSGPRLRVSKVSGPTNPGGVFVFPPFRLDSQNEQLWCGEQRIPLRHRPLEVLRCLLERPGELVTKEQLLGELWPGEYVGEGVLATYLSEIRRALRDSARSPRFIETAHGRGYRFIGALAAAEAELPAPASESSPASVSPRAGTAPFVGRENELVWLHDALGRARSSRREVLFICGEAGIGKTQLVRTFLEQVTGAGAALVAWGQCVDQYGAGEAYLPWLEALGRLARGPEGARWVEVLRQHAPSWLALLPAISSGFPASERPAMPERMLREMAEALEVLTQDRLLVLWLDDLHWADPSTLDLVSYVAQRDDPARLLLLTTYRREESRAMERLLPLEQHLGLRGHSRELALPFLDREAVSAYLNERFPANEFPRELGELLHRLTSGNPLFIVQLATFWIERGALSWTPTAWQLRETLDDLTRGIPETLTRMIDLQLRGLDDLERGLLEAASVAGAQFCSAALAAALGEDILRIEAVCTRWSRHRQFLRLEGTAEWPDGTCSPQFGFIHALYRHALYEQIGATQRSRLHSRIGERLEAAYATRSSDVASELALHFERARDFPRAVRHLREAAGHALRRSAYREASEHLHKALQLLPKLPEPAALCDLELELCLSLGSALTVIRGYADPEVASVYARARELCQSRGDTPHLATVTAGVAGFFIVRGAHGEGARLCEQICALAARHGDAEAEAAGRLGLGLTQLFRGELAGAEEHFQAIIRRQPGQSRVHILQFKEDPRAVATCFSAHGLIMAGYPDRALSLARSCLVYAEELRDPLATAFALLALQFVHQCRGEFAASAQRAAELLELARAQGFKLHEAIAVLGWGTATVASGRLEQGLGLMRAGWEGYHMTGAELGSTYWQCQMLEAYAIAGDTEAAWQVYEQTRDSVQRLEERHWEAELYRLEARLLQRAPAADAAERCYATALELARSRRQRAFELRAAQGLAELWQAQGRRAEAHALLAGVYEWFREGLDTLDLKNARTLLDALDAES